MKLIWRKWKIVPDQYSFGHGVVFHDTRKPKDANLVAWVDGFAWLHGNPRSLTFWRIPADSITTEADFADLTEALIPILQDKKLPVDSITAHIYAWPNC